MQWPVISVSEQTLWTCPSHPRHATVVFLKACLIIALLWYIYCFGHNNIICSTINVRHRVKWDHVIMILYSNISGGLLDAGDMARVVSASCIGMVSMNIHMYIIIWVLGCSIDDWFAWPFFSWTSCLWGISLGEGAIQATLSLCFLKYIYYVAVF